MNDFICKEHSGIIARIETVENNVKALWDKWDGVQKLLIGTLVTLVFNLIGIVALLSKTFFK